MRSGPARRPTTEAGVSRLTPASVFLTRVNGKPEFQSLTEILVHRIGEWRRSDKLPCHHRHPGRQRAHELIADGAADAGDIVNFDLFAPQLDRRTDPGLWARR